MKSKKLNKKKKKISSHNYQDIYYQIYFLVLHKCLQSISNYIEDLPIGADKIILERSDMEKLLSQAKIAVRASIDDAFGVNPDLTAERVGNKDKFKEAIKQAAIEMYNRLPKGAGSTSITPPNVNLGAFPK